jgi:hypothetical protein
MTQVVTSFLCHVFVVRQWLYVSCLSALIQLMLWPPASPGNRRLHQGATGTSVGSGAGSAAANRTNTGEWASAAGVREMSGLMTLHASSICHVCRCSPSLPVLTTACQPPQNMGASLLLFYLIYSRKASDTPDTVPVPALLCCHQSSTQLSALGQGSPAQSWAALTEFRCLVHKAVRGCELI